MEAYCCWCLGHQDDWNSTVNIVLFDNSVFGELKRFKVFTENCFGKIVLDLDCFWKWWNWINLLQKRLELDWVAPEKTGVGLLQKRLELDCSRKDVGKMKLKFVLKISVGSYVRSMMKNFCWRGLYESLSRRKVTGTTLLTLWRQKWLNFQQECVDNFYLSEVELVCSKNSWSWIGLLQ